MIDSSCEDATITYDEIFISEVYDKSNSTFYEIYNPTNEPVNLSNYRIKQINNGNTFQYYSLGNGNLNSGSTYVIGYVGNNSAPECSNYDNVTSTGSNLNGKDGIYLQKKINPIGSWSSGSDNNAKNIDLWGTPDGESGYDYDNFTHRRKPDAIAPSLSFNLSDWITSSPNCSNLGSHDLMPPPLSPQITEVRRHACDDPTKIQIFVDSESTSFHFELTGLNTGINFEHTTVNNPFILGTNNFGTPLPPDTYTLIITDINNCTTTIEFTIDPTVQTTPITEIP